MKPKEILTSDDIVKKFLKKHKNFKNKTFLEIYGVFMGECQILEFGLKRLLVHNLGFTEKQVERKTLGWVIFELRKNKLRPDFIFLLYNLRNYRNNFAHDFLVDKAFFEMILGKGKSFTKPFRTLNKAIFESSQSLVIFDFLNEKSIFWTNIKKNKIQIKIHKLIEEVFNFTTNPSNTKKWVDFVKKEKRKAKNTRKGVIYIREEVNNRKYEYKVSDFKKNKLFQLEGINIDHFIQYKYISISSNKTIFEYSEWSKNNTLDSVLINANLEDLNYCIFYQ